MKQQEFKVESIWWSDEEVFYVELFKDNAFFITTLEMEDFDESRVELNINDINFTYMPENDAKKIAAHALNKYYSANKFFNTDLPLIEDMPPLLIQIFHSIKSSPQSFWEYSPNDKDELAKKYKFNVIANILKDAALQYKFTDVLDIDAERQTISIYGDFICRFKTHRIIDTKENVEVLIKENKKDEIVLMI